MSIAGNQNIRKRSHGAGSSALPAKGNRCYPNSRCKSPRVFLGAAVALSGLGCSKGWQCEQQAVPFDPSRDSNSVNPLVRWTFDDPNAWGTPVGGRGQLAPTSSGAVIVEPGQWGGVGSTIAKGTNQVQAAAVHFDGAGCLVPEDAGLPPTQFTVPLTYSLWIAPHERWLEPDAGGPMLDPDAGVDGGADTSAREMVLLLTKWKESNNCAGHEIALTRSGHVGLIFRYWHDSDCDTGQGGSYSQTSSNPVPDGYLSPDAWSGNKWHHVVAVVSNDSDSSNNNSQTVTLYWDQHKLPAELLHVGSNSNSKLCLGGSCLSTPGSARNFIGLMDEVAVFGQALNADQVKTLWLASHRPFRVGTSDWFMSSGPRSTGTLAPDPAGGLRLNVDDGPSSGASAVSPMGDADAGIKLAAASPAILSANLPGLSSGQAFGFNLEAHQGREFCTWYVTGHGGGRYYLGLLPPMGSLTAFDGNTDYTYTRKWCRCDDCDCSASVEEAVVYSPWQPTMGDMPSANICDMQLPRAVAQSDLDANDAETLSQKPGIIGPHHLCWRPIAYNPSSFAQLVKPNDPSGVSAHLAGDANAGALLVADFGVHNLPSTNDDSLGVPADDEQHLLSLDQCEFACINVFFEDIGETGGSQDSRIVLVSGNSATCEAVSDSAAEIVDHNNLNLNTSAKGRWYCIQLSTCSADPFQDGAIDETAWDKTGNGDKVTFDRSQIRYFGVQKGWNNPQDLVAEVYDIQFLSSSLTNNCALRKGWSSH